MSGEALVEVLRKTEWAAIRHHVSLYKYFGPFDEKMEGYWEYKENIEHLKNVFPTDRFEFKEDGTWAQVYELRKIDG